MIVARPGLLLPFYVYNSFYQGFIKGNNIFYKGDNFL